MELWQTAVQELDRLQQLYQRSVSEGQVHGAQRQQLKVQAGSHTTIRTTTTAALCGGGRSVKAPIKPLHARNNKLNSRQQ